MTNSEALAAWRTRHQLSQQAAGDDLGRYLVPITGGVTQATWGAWELGKKTPDLANAFAIEKMTRGEIRADGWPQNRRKARAAVRTKREPTPPSDSGTLHAAGDDDDHRAAS